MLSRRTLRCLLAPPLPSPFPPLPRPLIPTESVLSEIQGSGYRKQGTIKRWETSRESSCTRWRLRTQPCPCRTWPWAWRPPSGTSLGPCRPPSPTAWPGPGQKRIIARIYKCSLQIDESLLTNLGAHLFIRILCPLLCHEHEVGTRRPLGGVSLGGVRIGLGSHGEYGYLRNTRTLESDIREINYIPRYNIKWSGWQGICWSRVSSWQSNISMTWVLMSDLSLTLLKPRHHASSKFCRVKPVSLKVNNLFHSGRIWKTY